MLLWGCFHLITWHIHTCTTSYIVVGVGCDLMAGSRGRRAVQALMLEAAQSHVVADDVQYPHHLTED